MHNHDDLKGVRVLLLEGFSRQVMPLMQALHELGCHLTTYNSSKLDLGYASRYPDQKLIAFWDRKDPEKSCEALLSLLQSERFDVVIPLTDFSATLLSKNKDQLSRFAALAVNDWEIFQMASDKEKTMAACMLHGIPCPYTLMDVQCIEDILDSGISYPFVLKPRTGYGAIGFHCINDEQQLRHTFNKAIGTHGKMLVQEYIPQTDIQYKAQLFIDSAGELKSAVVFDKTRWYPIDGGSSCCCATVKRPDIVENSLRLLQVIGWRGYADIDLIQDPRDQVAKVMEINPRITGSVKICFDAGVDFARQIIERETGREVTDYKDYLIDRRLRYMHTDILWFIKSPMRFRANPSWFSFRNTTDQIFSLKDPWPFVTNSIQAMLRLPAELKKRSR